MNAFECDFLYTAAILTAVRAERYLSEKRKEKPHGKLTRFLERYSEIPRAAVMDFLSEDVRSAPLAKQRYQSILLRVEPSLRLCAETLIGLSLMNALFPEVKEALREAGLDATISFAYKISGGDNCPSEFAARLFNALYPIFLPEIKENEWCADVRFTAGKRLMLFLCGIDDETDETGSFFDHSEALSPLYLYGEKRDEISRIISRERCVVQIKGSEGSGKKHLLKHAAVQSGFSVLFLDFEEALSVESERIKEYILELIRDALLRACAVCWYGICGERLEDKMSIRVFVKRFIKPFQNQGIRVFCCTDDKTFFSSCLDPKIYSVEIPRLTTADRETLWRSFCEEYGCSDIDCGQQSCKYKLSIKQLASSFENLKLERKLSNDTDIQILKRNCGGFSTSPQRLLHVVKTEYRLSDLILPKRDIERIREICECCKNSFKVYNEWEMARKMPYGRSVSVLLVGLPGTGKTMTAHVIANMLELPLFHADLSQISDKYIGETEKNLEIIFSEAEKTGCVLFLDEADSICGKRSEVTDAHDRYANNSTSFLLQRLEEYDGIVILSTNLISNIDDAFMRRMKFIINFSVPDAAVRLDLWRTSFTDKMPLSDDIDLSYIAERFEFTGASIKNIVLEAAFLAVMNDTEIKMEYILKSIANEYLKLRKHVLPGEFGRYGELYKKTQCCD